MLHLPKASWGIDKHWIVEPWKPNMKGLSNKMHYYRGRFSLESFAYYKNACTEYTSMRTKQCPSIHAHNKHGFETIQFIYDRQEEEGQFPLDLVLLIVCRRLDSYFDIFVAMKQMVSLFTWYVDLNWVSGAGTYVLPIVVYRLTISRVRINTVFHHLSHLHRSVTLESYGIGQDSQTGTGINPIAQTVISFL